MGRQLQPFSFGHFIILRRFNVGFVSDEEAKLTLEDIIFSIYVCSHTYRECEEKIYRGKWTKEVTEWGIEVRKQIQKSVPEGKTIESVYIDFGDIASLFTAYIEHHTVRPMFKVRHVGEREPMEANAEWYEGILKVLMGKCGYSHDEVMDLSFSRALYEYLSYKEQRGEITFLNDKQEQQVKKIIEERKKANGTR